MAEPSQKSPQITEFLERFAGRSSAIEGNVCVNPPIGCGGPATEFRDELSAKEYTISGLCQNCQNEIFDVPVVD